MAAGDCHEGYVLTELCELVGMVCGQHAMLCGRRSTLGLACLAVDLPLVGRRIHRRDLRTCACVDMRV